MGKVSKQVLSKINSDLRQKVSLNSWKNTHAVIDWFKGLKNKEKLVFIQFDVCEFYPSITKKLFEQALDYAGQYVSITQDERRVLMDTKKGLLFCDKQVWMKKGKEPYDVTMGSFDGAQVR